MRRLQGLHTYLVQLSDSRWHVCVWPERDAAELLPGVLRTVGDWAAERQTSPVVRVGERSYEPRA